MLLAHALPTVAHRAHVDDHREESVLAPALALAFLASLAPAAAVLAPAAATVDRARA